MWWMAIAGAAANQIGYLQQSDRQRKEIERQKKMAQEAYGYERQYADASYNLQRGEALAALGVQRNRLAEALGADVAGFNLGLEGQALQSQQARVSMAEGAGAALAAQGASGARGSDSLQRRIDFHETQFARQADLQERGNSLAVRNMARAYTNQFDDIGREVDSWNPGGYRHRAKTLADTYAAQMHGLRMRDYDHAYGDAEFNFLDFMVAGLGGAGQGAAFGQQIENLRDQKR